MNNYNINCDYYLVFKNLECVQSNLPQDVIYENHLIKFFNKEPIDLQIIYDLDDEVEFNITYEMSRHTQVQIIETKLLKPNSILNKQMNLKENAHVLLFSEVDVDHHNKVFLSDEVTLLENASIQSGYAELSNGRINATYNYQLNGINAHAKVRMAALSESNDRKKYEVKIQHNAPLTHGTMDNYGVVKDQGHLIIDGIGTITKGQHGSANHQTNKIMVFDPECVASANPYLYIDEYDVKASHAAGVGKMDEEHLYYLQSRGLTKKQAMHLITYGYLKPVIDVVDNPVLKEHFEEVLSKVGA